MGSGRDNPYLPELESKSSQSLTVLSVFYFAIHRLLRFVWKGYGRNWWSVIWNPQVTSRN